MRRTFVFCSSLHYLPNCQVCLYLVKLVTNPTHLLFKFVLCGISYKTFKVASYNKMDKSILEWVLFVILSALAFGFMIWGEVLNKFLLHSTSFMQYTEEFHESPTVAICFSSMTINGTVLEYGKDFQIVYR